MANFWHLLAWAGALLQEAPGDDTSAVTSLNSQVYARGLMATPISKLQLPVYCQLSPGRGAQIPLRRLVDGNGIILRMRHHGAVTLYKP